MYDVSRYVDTDSEIGSIAGRKGGRTPSPAPSETVDKVTASEGYRLAGLDRKPSKNGSTAEPETATATATSTPPHKTTTTASPPAASTAPAPTTDVNTDVAAAAETKPASKSLARRVSDFIPEGVWRNFAILWGACFGALYEVATMPTTVSNFNKAVYATTGYLGEYLPKVRRSRCMYVCIYFYVKRRGRGEGKRVAAFTLFGGVFWQQ